MYKGAYVAFKYSLNKDKVLGTLILKKIVPCGSAYLRVFTRATSSPQFFQIFPRFIIECSMSQKLGLMIPTGPRQTKSDGYLRCTKIHLTTILFMKMHCK
jgi:hypothetical protein